MNATADAVLDAQDVSKSFGDDRALDGVSLQVYAGRIHALVGLNGAGKTTLMRTMLGMIRADAGRVSIRTGVDAVPLEHVSASTWRHVGYLVDSPFGYPELTAAETIVAAARLRGMSAASARSAAQRMIDRLALRQWADRRARQLSMGNLQRLGLASALVHDPRLVILDEPANGLDPAGVRLIRDVLRASAASGAAILLSSHHLDEMARLADEITVMHRGRIVGTLPPEGVDIERQFFDMILLADQDDGGAS
ncbi:ABC transporter ATP-binding protein [Microbacterium sp. A93]|uniref:ABC transporter ATP-binding protein n=1 Tax=unclassified Microbacterium TaxID=2609290 RepID=UPI003F42E8CE